MMIDKSCAMRFSSACLCNIFPRVLFCLGATAALFLTSCGSVTSTSSGNYHVTAHRPHDPSKVVVKLSLSTQNLYVMEGDRLLMAVRAMLASLAPKRRRVILPSTTRKKSAAAPVSPTGVIRWPIGASSNPAYGFHEGFVHPHPHTHGCVRAPSRSAPPGCSHWPESGRRCISRVRCPKTRNTATR